MNLNPTFATPLVLFCTMTAAAAPARAQSPPPGGKGLKYWVAEDVVQIDAVVTTTTTTDYEITQGPDGKGKLELLTQSKVTRDGAVSSRTIADRRAPTYSLDVLGGKASDNSVSVTVSAAGLLESVSATTVGRGGQILTSIARFLGIAAGIVTGGVLGPIKLSPSDVNTLSRSVPAGEDFEGNALDRNGNGHVPETCDPYAPPFTTLPLRVRAFVAESQPGCLLFWQVRQSDTLLTKLRGQRTAREASLDTTPPAQLPALRQMIKELTAAIGNNEKIQADLQGRFNGLLEAFIADKELGTQARTEKFSVVLRLNEIPASLDKSSEYTKALEFFKSTGLIVVGVAAPTPEAAKKDGKKSDGTQAQEKDGTPHSQPADPKMMRIMFRQPAPWTLEVRSSRCNTSEQACRDAAPTSANTEMQALTPVDLISSTTETSFIEFEAKAFSEGKVAMSFEKGRPIKLERSGSSSAAAIAVSIADAARAAQTEYADSLTKIVEMQKSKREIELNDVNAQIEKAKRDKELLDAKIAATGTSQSFDMLLEQGRLNAELNLLQAQSNLQSAQETADQRLEIEALKVQLARLKAQIDLLTAQKQYDELQKN
jgi:hypothetical protein